MTPLLEDRRWRIISPELISFAAIRKVNKALGNLIPSVLKRNPRSLETLQEAVSPEYDQSNPLPPHHPRLSQFDRQIWEMCDVASPKVLMPHRDSSSIQYHYQLNPIMNWAGVKAEAAEIISEIGQALNATLKMMRSFCKEAKADLKGFICRMTPLVDGITEIEESYERQIPEIPNSIKVNKQALQALYQMLPDPENNDDDIEPKETGSTIGYHVMKDFSEIATMRKDLWAQYKDHYDRFFDPEDDGYFSDNEIEELWYKTFNWIRRQGSVFLGLLTKTRRGNREEIGRLANDVIEDRIKLNKIQKAVFFTEFDIRKGVLERYIKPVVSEMIRKIYSSNGRLGFIGVQLHKIQSKKRAFKYELQKHEWNQIWEAFFLEKELQGSRKELNKLKRELAML